MEGINQFREIGPAIVEDVYRYLQTTEVEDYVSPLVMYVVPQLEGLRNDDLVGFVTEISQRTPIDETRLVEFVADYFGMSAAAFEGDG